MATAMLNARIWYHDQALSTQLNAVALDYSAEELDATVLTDTTRVRAGGLKDAQAAIAGFWNSTEDKALFDAIGLNHPLLISSGPTVGDVAYGIVALEGVWSLEGEHGELLGFNITLNSGNDGPLVRGQLAFGSQISSSGNGTALELGLVAAGQRVYSGLHVTQFDGTSLDVVIQGDAESAMGSPAGHITFAQATGLTSEWGSKAGAIADDDWWRVNYTFVGTNVTFAVLIGIL